MGRQPYLTRLALKHGELRKINDHEIWQCLIDLIKGRSAFESPIEGTFSTFSGSTEVDVGGDALSIPQEYLQLYDDDGRPVNPRSQAYGRRLRAAQNDVFAAFGVVQRKEQEAAELDEDDTDIEAEELTAESVDGATTSPAHIFSWWILVLKTRFLGIPNPPDLPLSTLIQSEFVEHGAAIFHRGIGWTLVHNFFKGIFLYELSYSRLLGQFILWTNLPRNQRRMLQKTTPWGSAALSLFMELTIIPFSYYSTLEVLDLVPNKFLPPLGMFIPGSPYCPWPKLKFPSDFSQGAFTSFLLSALLSPASVLIVSNRLTAGVHGYLPTCCDIQARLILPRKWHHEEKDVVGKINILMAERPILTRTLSFLGWGLTSTTAQPRTASQAETAGTNAATASADDIPSRGNLDPRTILEVPPPPPAAASDGYLPPQTPRNPIATVHDILADEASTELPPSPGQRAQVDAWNTSGTHELDALDGPVEMEQLGLVGADSRTRVRITTREPGTLTVELEIDSTELNGVSDRQAMARETTIPASTASYLKQHRVTRLSMGPSRFLAELLSIEIATLVEIPLKFVAIRFVALYFTDCTLGALSGKPTALHSFSFWKRQVTTVNTKSFGALVYRMAFCTSASLIVDLAFWGINFGLTRYYGLTYHGWGKL